MIIRCAVYSDDWRPWFAWRPVFVDIAKGQDALVWLQMVERRWAQRGIDGEWDYRLPGDDRHPDRPLGPVGAL